MQSTLHSGCGNAGLHTMHTLAHSLVTMSCRSHIALMGKAAMMKSVTMMIPRIGIIQLRQAPPVSPDSRYTSGCWSYVFVAVQAFCNRLLQNLPEGIGRYTTRMSP